MLIWKRIKREWHCFTHLHRAITLKFTEYVMGHAESSVTVLLCECGKCFNPECEMELPPKELEIVSNYVDNLKENHGVKNPTMGP
jgi:hypothetical protein